MIYSRGGVFFRAPELISISSNKLLANVIPDLPTVLPELVVLQRLIPISPLVFETRDAILEDEAQCIREWDFD